MFMMQGSSTKTLFFNRGNFGCGNSFVILIFDTCQVESLQFIIMLLISIKNRMEIIGIYYKNGRSMKITYPKISKFSAVITVLLKPPLKIR